MRFHAFAGGVSLKLGGERFTDRDVTAFLILRRPRALRLDLDSLHDVQLEHAVVPLDVVGRQRAQLLRAKAG